VHIREGEVPSSVNPRVHASCPSLLNSLGGVVSADQVVDDVRVPDALLDRLGVVKVVFLAFI
jgi:hypothetical protein